jgi:fructose-specific phosphotransferase system IIA component
MEENIAGVMANLVLQIGIILFTVRFCGKLVKKIGIPSVLGELIAGVIIGPYALGGIALPGFPQGMFPLHSASLAVSPELYAFSTVASIILLFASGLETDLGLFLRYSVSGGIIGLFGVVVSFVFGDLAGMFMLHTSFMDVRCLFLGIMSTATSVGITARILSDKKKMDSPEGVTILAAAVFDDVLGIILLAVVLGVVSVMSSGSGSIDAGSIGLIAVRAFGIWLGFTALGLIFAKKIAGFLKLFKSSFDFSICALGIALILAGVFEKQGLAMIIGAYITGLSLSGTDIAAVIQERIHGLYEFFVPLFFAVMGMMVNISELMNKEVLIFGAIYTVLAILAKVIGCATPALTLGFNMKGALRIGCGMIPRGEVALIIAGIGITAGILDDKLFGVVIMMTLITTLVAPPVLNFVLGISGRGTRKETRTSDTVSFNWDFGTDEIADLVIDILLKDLKQEGFYVQMMNIDEGISQARKGDVVLSITEEESNVTIETAVEDMGFVKTSIYEVMLKLNDSVQELKENNNPLELQKEMYSAVSRFEASLLQRISEKTIKIDLKGETKEEILNEMVSLLANSGFVQDWELVLDDVKNRERVMTTGMERGIALPHAKSDGVTSMCVAIGVKKSGVNYGSFDGQPSKLFIMVVSPKKASGPHLQVLSAIGGLLHEQETVNKLLDAQSSSDIMKILRELSKKK